MKTEKPKKSKKVGNGLGENKPIASDRSETPENDPLVVGIGASAGGVRALKEFFENVSPKSNIAYRDVFSLLESDIGRPISDLQSRLEYTDVLSDAEIVLDNLQMIESDVRTADGRTYLMQITPYRTAEDRIDGVVLAFFDITKRVQAEANLRAAHEQVSNILESITDAFYAVDREWRFTYVNRRAEEFWSKSRAELLGKDIREIFPGAEEEELYKGLKSAAASGRVQKFESFSPKLKRWIDVSVYPAADGLSVYFRDVSERKRREENLAFLADINNDLA